MALIAQHRVERGQQLAHDRDDGDLGLLALGQQALLEGLRDRVVQGGGLGCHEPDVANPGPTAEDAARATHAAAVEIVRHEPRPAADPIDPKMGPLA